MIYCADIQDRDVQNLQALIFDTVLMMWQFQSLPVGVIEKSRVNPLPDIPKRTFGVKDPPEEKKG